MAEAIGRIAELSQHDQAQIRSSVLITSLADVILELVKNSLDARAHNIQIQLDFIKGFCSVLDDGIGILRDEFAEGRLAKSYHTSKADSRIAYHGQYGRFLASLSNVSLITITSSHEKSNGTNILVLKDGLHVATSLDCPTREELGHNASGTKVVVYNLFGNIPVRAKHQSERFEDHAESDREFCTLKRQLVALILASPIALNLRLSDLNGKRQFEHRSSREMITRCKDTRLDLQSIRSTLFQAGLISSDAQDWRAASVHSDTRLIRAAICLKPSSKRDIQFISVGQKPTGFNILYNEINALFASSNFGRTSEDKEEKDDAPSKQLRITQAGLESPWPMSRRLSSVVKHVDRWPMFYINIETERDSTIHDLSSYTNSSMITQEVREISLLLQSLIKEFLRSYGFHTMHDLRKSKRYEEPQIQRYDLDLNHDQSLHNSFSRWSRTKSAQTSSQGDLLSGLPFNDSGFIGHFTPTSALSPCNSSHVIKSAVDSPNLSVQADVISKSTEVPNNNKDSSINRCNENVMNGVIEWTNSRTGCTSFLNSRTGMIVPHQHLKDTNADNQHHYPKFKSLPTGPRTFMKTAARSINHNVLKLSSETFIPSVVEKHSYMFGSLEHRLQIPIECFLGSTQALQIRGSSCSTEISSSNVTKDGLKRAKIVGQIDNKYILILVPTPPDNKEKGLDITELLVAVDQHAADERVRVEELYSQICNCTSEKLSPLITFSVSVNEAALFQEMQEYFVSWNIDFDIIPDHENRMTVMIQVTAIPETVAERCRVEPRLLVETLRKEVCSLDNRRQKPTISNHWLSRISSCPQGILEMINSRACRSAVMFNDVLTAGQSQSLVDRLGECLFPFQCAHGRPSMVILASITDLNARDCSIEHDMIPTFSQGWRKWLEK